MISPTKTNNFAFTRWPHSCFDSWLGTPVGAKSSRAIPIETRELAVTKSLYTIKNTIFFCSAKYNSKFPFPLSNAQNWTTLSNHLTTPGHYFVNEDQTKGLVTVSVDKRWSNYKETPWNHDHRQSPWPGTPFCETPSHSVGKVGHCWCYCGLGRFYGEGYISRRENHVFSIFVIVNWVHQQ